MEKKYIKVTPKDGKGFTVVPASNEAFYKSQGYTVTDPTEAEIAEFFPVKGEKTSVLPVEETEEYKALKTELETVLSELEALKAKPVTETSEYVALIQELEAAKAEKTTFEAKVAELEAIKIELEKQIAKK